MNCQPLTLVLILVRIGHKAVRGEAAWSQVLTDLLGSDGSAQGCLLPHLCPKGTTEHLGSRDNSLGQALVAVEMKASWWPWAGDVLCSALVSLREAREGERHSKMNEILGQ